jgi:zinc transport system permease protein
MNELPGLSLFFESWVLFADAVWAGVLAGLTLGVLGVYIVLGRMVFLTAALSQVAGLGVAASYLLAATAGGLFGWLSPGVGGLVFVLMCLIFALRFDEGDRTQRDAVLGMLFVGGSAGTLMIGSVIPQEMTDIQSLLFGSAVAVLPEDLMTIVVVVVVTLVMQLLGWRGFVEMIYDPTTARVRQLPIGVLRWALVGSLALMIATTTRTLGALPTFSFTILPAIVAIRWAANVPRAMALAAVVGALMGFWGYFAAFRYGFPVGASQTAVGLVLLALSAGVSVVFRRFKPEAVVAAPVEPQVRVHSHGHHHHHDHAHQQSDTDTRDSVTK